ncbi:hypothetical protein ALQ33_200020 [Pseudomonas syringae pv. philadelphi]|uniref:Uncharacterized protein n=1 Tax=Pseudomonas syringae pv. philadelphi TaxID=251706 RepID=A0A3M3YBG1_9PSED|nr:hypothetical protein [Pseudomonas syringae group genomosp. 3]RMO79787.1 hypothetical protein ALQ33_200020 [Pseudomonas syringae pv. philadelphi]
MTALRLVSSSTTDQGIDRFNPAPVGESKAEKVKRQARERKQKQRRKEAAQKVRAEAYHMPAMTFYGGTVQAMIDVVAAGGFEESAEAMTLLAHGSASLARKDPAAFAELFAPVLVALSLMGADLAKRDSHAFAKLITPPSRSEDSK